MRQRGAPPEPSAFRRRAAGVLMVVLVATTGLLLARRGLQSPARLLPQRVVVLVFDGVEASLLERRLEEGLLPNLAALRREGGYARLVPPAPAAPAVVWADFATGADAGVHGVFDAWAHTSEDGYRPRADPFFASYPGRFLWELFPTQRPRVEALRRGTDFWTVCSEAGVRSVVLGGPCLYPAVEAPHVRLLSGAGTPALCETYSLFTSNAEELEDAPPGPGGTRLLLAEDEQHVFTAQLAGPPHMVRAQDLGDVEAERTELLAEIEEDSRRRRALQSRLDRLDKRIAALRDGLRVRAPLHLRRTPSGVELELAGARQLVDRGAWSRWFHVSFAVGPLHWQRGSVRFFVLETEPHLRVYATPVDCDLAHPALPLAAPEGFGAELAESAEPFKTRGTPYETAALADGVLGDAAFRADLLTLMEDRARAATALLARRKTWNLLLVTFTAPEMAARAFRRAEDRQHPLFDLELSHRFGETVLETYRRMDAIVGETYASLDRETTLLVISPRGTAPFHYAIHTNRWLAEQGFLALREGPGGQAIDWPATRAYAFGWGGVYVNLEGREPQGCVSADDYHAVRDAVRAALLELVDRERQAVVARVDLAEDLWHGPLLPDDPRERRGPDLVVSFHAGYRTSEPTLRGEVPLGVIEHNRQVWGADARSVDPDAVPGFLLASRPLAATQARVLDVAPTILAELGLAAPETMRGRPLLDSSPAGD